MSGMLCRARYRGRRARYALRMGCFAVLVFAWGAGAANAEHLSDTDKITAQAFMQALDQKRAKSIRANVKKIDNPLLQKTLYWFFYTQAPKDATFEELSQFIDDNPQWPSMVKLQKHAEEVMQPAMPAEDVVAWFNDRAPISTQGKVRLAAALLKLKRKDEAVTMLRDAWVGGSFTKAQERHFYKIYRRHLTREDHLARLDRLLWEGSYWPARRMFGKVNKDYRLLAEARFLLRHRRGNVDKAIARVPQSLKNHPALVYERLRWRRSKGKTKAAWELLENPPADMVRPDLWLRERAILARRALDKGRISLAYKLVREHGLKSAKSPDYIAEYADAEWLAGWIALRFLQEPQWALDHFTNMYSVVRFPVSVSRAAYWAGRASEAAGADHARIETWFTVAAGHATTYYGQLAAARLGLGDEALIDHDLELTGMAQGRFSGHELSDAAKLLAEIDAENYLRRFILALRDFSSGPSWKVMAARLAKTLGRPDLAIKVFKDARIDGHNFLTVGYPVVTLPPLPAKAKLSAPEKPLILSLIRQESAYYTRAKSGVGARGLMQLMPATAKLVARQVGLPYSKEKLLSDAGYNLKLGQSYLAQLLDNFGGSYVLALAAYNAGPRRAKAWMKRNGDPRDAEVDAIDWVELIPFDETRNYVQRVLEGVQVYRSMMAETTLAFSLDSDLVR